MATRIEAMAKQDLCIGDVTLAITNVDAHRSRVRIQRGTAGYWLKVGERALVAQSPRIEVAVVGFKSAGMVAIFDISAPDVAAIGTIADLNDADREARYVAGCRKRDTSARE